MIWARMAFVILFLSPLLPFSGAVHVSVNQALAQRQGNEKPFPLAPPFSAIIPCKHLVEVASSCCSTTLPRLS